MEVQSLERTVVLLGNRGRLENCVLKLLPGGGSVHDENGDKEEAFIPRLEILQQPLCLAAVGGKVGRDNFHIVAGSYSLFLFLNLHLVEVGDLHLNALDGLRLIDGADMEVDGDVAVHIKEVREHPVIQLRRENLQEAHRADGLAHLEALALPEVKGGGCDEVLTAQPCPGNHIE